VEIHLRHRIALSAERFWALLHTERYEQAVARALGLHAYRELERRERGDEVYRRIEVEGPLPESLEGLARRLGIGGVARYEEEQWTSRSRRRVRWRATPPILQSRSTVEGTVRVEPVDPEHCERVLEGEVRVRMPGLGRLAERSIVSHVGRSYGRTARVAEQIAAEEPPT